MIVKYEISEFRENYKHVYRSKNNSSTCNPYCETRELYDKLTLSREPFSAKH